MRSFFRFLSAKSANATIREDPTIAEHPCPNRYKRGTVLHDRLGRRWLVSNRGNAYEINSAGHRQGSHRYNRLWSLEQDFGPFVQEETSAT